MLVFAVLSAVPTHAQTVPNVCARTEEVADAIVAAVDGADGCADVTAEALAGITELDFTGGSIGSLQAGDFDGLSALKKLRLQNTALSSLPPGIFDELSALESLDLGPNPLSSLPPGIFDKLAALIHLDLRFNALSSLPPGIFDELSALEELRLQDTILTSLPPGIFDGLTTLGILDLRSNALSSLPPGIFDGLTTLETLRLNDNALSSLPPGIFDGLTTLTRLHLSSNALTSAGVPDDVFERLTALTVLDLSDNRDTFAPTADAGPAQTAPRGTVVMLSGSASGPWGDGNVIYTWSQTGGVDVELISANTADPTFTVPLSARSLTFGLTATGRGGDYVGTTATVVVDVADGVCARTEEVADAIVATVSLANDCADVTAADLAGITRLALQNRGVSSLKTGDFAGLSALEVLDLGPNALSSLPPGIFDDLSALETLDLRTNALSSLPPGIFDDLSALDELRLENNALSSLPPGIFDGLSALEILDLSRNALTSAGVPDDVFERLTALTQLRLSGNSDTFAPTANAGAAQTVPRGTAATLAGSASGPWGDGNVIYAWSQTGGADVTLIDADTADPTFTAPLPSDSLTFKLTVTGRGGDYVGTDTVVVTVEGIAANFASGTYSVAESDNPDTADAEENKVLVEVLLSADPERTVTILIVDVGEGGADAADYSGVPGSVVFDAGVTAAAFALTAADNDEDDDGKGVRLTFGELPDGVSPGATPTAMVSIIDNDEAGLSAVPASVSTDEGGSTAEVTMSLRSRPTAAVTLTAASSKAEEAGVSPASLVFAPGAWNAVQAFTVTGVDDEEADGDQGYEIRVTSSSSDANYEGEAAAVSGTNADDDVAGLVAVPASVSTNEGGSTAEVTMSLRSRPTAAVTLTAGSSDAEEAGVSPPSLVFAPGAWNAVQAFTVTGVDDEEADGDQGYEIRVTATSSDANYEGEAAAVSGTNADDDVAGLVAVPASVSTNEGGSTAEVTMSLRSRPTAAVTLTAGSSDAEEAGVSPPSLVFAPGAWNVVQAFTVTGVDDEEADGDQGYEIRVTSSSSDANYEGQAAAVSGTNADDDVAGLVAVPASVSTNEGGSTAEVTMSLRSRPTAAVTLTAGSSDAEEAGVSPPSLVFAPGAWNAVQAFTVTGVDDEEADGDQGYEIRVTATSSDANYEGEAAAVSGTNADDDVAGLVAVPASVSTNEGGSTAEVTMSLRSRPTAAVTLTAGSSDAEEAGVSPPSLVFAPGAWNVVQAFTVTGVDDEEADGDQGYEIRVTSSSSDANYEGQAAAVSGTNADDDVAGLVAVPASVSTNEGGSTAEVTMSLRSRPTAAVTLTAGSSDAEEAGVSPPSLVFAPGAWNAVQAFTVTGVDDEEADGDQTYEIRVTATSSDANYEGQAAAVSGTNADDDVAGLVAVPASVSTNEGGSTAEVTMSLRSRPTAAVTLTAGSSDAEEAGVSPASLVFAPERWNAVQAFTVTGVDDEEADGDQGYEIRVTATSSDANYEGEAAAVSGTNADDDVAGLVAVPASVSTNEGGSTAEVTMSLRSRPTAAVTLTAGSSDAEEAGVSPPSLVFAPGAWNAVQAFTVTGVDDEEADGDQGYEIRVTSSSSDANYEGQAAAVSGTNADDDVAGLVAVPASVSTNEGGSTAEVTMSLRSRPTAAVTLTAASSKAEEAGVSPASLVFAPERWNAVQAFTVTGVDDEEADGDQGYEIRVTSSSSDANYAGQAAAVSGTNADDDVAGLVAVPASVSTNEGGSTAEVTMSLRSRPTAAVTLTAASSKAEEAGVSPASLVFAPERWNAVQAFTVTGVDDEEADGDQGYEIRVTSSSSDANYAGQAAAVSGTNADDDVAGLVAVPASVSTNEGGSTAEVTMSLRSRPTAAVTLTAASSKAEEAGVSPASLVFAPERWNAVQAFTVTGVDDEEADGDQGYEIRVTSSSSDANYAGQAAAVSGTNADDDVAGLVAVPASVSTNEGGSTAEVTMSLRSRPTAAVTLTAASSKAEEAGVSPASLVFAPERWNAVQAFTVTGVDDEEADGDQGYEIRVTSSSSDANYAGQAAAVSGTNADDDVAGLVAVPASVSTNEGGSTAEVTMSLRSRPTAAVTLTAASSKAEEAGVSPASLVFAPERWNAVQAFTVTGVDDEEADGDQGYEIRVTSSSSDANYEGQAAAVSGTNADDDVAGLVAVPASVSTNEGGSTAEVTMSLRSRPTAAVTLTAASSKAEEAGVSPASLVFAPERWNAVQAFTVTGVDDEEADGDQGYEIRVTSSSSDANYEGQAAAVSGTNADDDVAGLVAVPASVSTNEGGSTAEVTMSLRSRPTAAVTLTAASSKAEEAGVSPASLVFAPERWNAVQAFTVTGVDDEEADGDQGYEIRVTSSSSDANYAGQAAAVSGTNADDDVAGLVAVPASVSTNEGGSTAEVTMSLRSRPTAAVTLTAASSKAEEAGVSPASLVFAPERWNAVQAFTVTGVDDDEADGDQGYEIRMTSSSSDANYAGQAAAVSGTNADDDEAGLSAVPGSVSTDEGGSTAEVTVSLRSRPTAAVTLTAGSSDAEEAAVSPASLVFAPGAWNAVQAFTVTGVDDDEADGDQGYEIRVTSSSSDANYAGQAAAVSGTNADDDVAGLVAVPASVSTNEGGSTAEVTMSLRSRPTAEVTLTAVSSDAEEARVSPPSLVFAPERWNAVQAFTVTGVDDDEADGDQGYEIRMTSSSSDANYAGQAAAVSGTNADDDEAGLSAVPGSVSTDEGGSTAEVTVSLRSRPTAAVTLTAGSSDAEEAAVSPASLVFAPGAWNAVQAFTVTGVDDDEADGDQGYEIRVTSSSSDANYAGQAAAVSGTNADDDVAGLVAVPASVSTNEGGSTAEVTMSLRSRPTAEVTLTAVSSDAEEARVSPPSLVFAPGAWNAVQAFTVTGVDDEEADGDQGYEIRVTATSSDANYAGQAAAVSGTNADDDEAGLSAVPGSVSTDEGGLTAEVTVSLRSRPTAEVTLTAVSSDAEEARVSPPSLVFAPGAWNAVQAFTVTGVDDEEADGDQGYEIRVTATSSDANYAGQAAAVSGTNADDDEAGLSAVPGSVSTDEGGLTAEVTVSLRSRPTAEVTLTAVSSDAEEARVSPPSLVFAPGAWNAVQAFTVTGVDDDEADGDQGYEIRMTATSSDANYAGQAAAVSGTNADDDEAGLSAVPGSVSTDEGGLTAEVTVSLRSRPTAEVTLTAASSDAEEASLSPPSLVFAPGAWNAVQAFTVTGVDDDEADGDQGYEIRVTATSSDANYAGQAAAVSGTNADDDEAGLSAVPGSVSTDEGGSTAEVTVSLRSRPTAEVTLTAVSSDAEEARVSPPSLVFAPGAWNGGQAFTVTGVDDEEADGDQTYEIRVTATSSDANYAGQAAAVSGTNADDDAAGLSAVPESVSTDEGGLAAEVTMSLRSRPTAEVTLTAASSDAEEAAVSPATLVFAPGAWNAGQAFTVTGVDDDEADGDRDYKITVTSASSDANYAGQSAEIAGVNADDDAAGLSAVPESVSTDEGGSAAEVTVSLRSRPTAEVTLTAASSDAEEAAVSPASLVFAPGAWNAGQAFTVTGVDDDEADGDQDYKITVVSASSDANYAGQSAEIAGVNADDDAAGLSAVPESVSTDEGGSAAEVTVSLRSRPTAEVTLTAASSDAEEAAVSPASLVFAPGAWNAGQAFTVTGVDDDEADGDQDYKITVVSASSDANYAGQSAEIAGVNADDDAAGLSAVPESVSTDEGGSAAEVTVSLRSRPTAEVTLTAASSDAEEAAVSPATLVFAPGAWNAGQAFTVTGVDDDEADGDQAYEITVSSSSSDAGYAGRSVEIAGVNADDDEAGLSAGAERVSTDEGGSAAEVTMSLRSRPTGEVTLTAASSDAEEAAVSPSSLVFAPGAWNGGQAFTVTGVDDEEADGNQAYEITVTSSSSDADYAGRSVEIAGVNADDDEAGLSAGAERVSTDEGGSTAELTMSLRSRPTGEVTLTAASSDAEEAAVSPSSLVFAPEAWNGGQAFTVTGVDDDEADGDQAYEITVSSSSSDAGYAGRSVEIAGVNADDDVAGLSAVPESVSTDEGGSTAELTMSLRSRPTAEVTLTAASSDAEEARVSPPALVFAPGAWNAVQAFTVTGVDDEEADGDQSYEIRVTARSSDANYEGQAAAVSGTNTDNDEAGLWAVPGSVSTNEGGSTAEVTVSLRSRPTAEVTLTAASSDAEEARVSPATLVFAPGAWNAGQAFTVTGVDDDKADGDRGYEIPGDVVVVGCGLRGSLR